MGFILTGPSIRSYETRVSLLDSIVLAQVSEVSPRMKRSLIDRFGSASHVIEAARSLDSKDETEQALLNQIAQSMDRGKAQRELDQLLRLKGWGVGYGDPNYPFLLAQIPDPPLVLFGRGKPLCEIEVRLGFVGPRRPSTYGTRVARWLSKDLAEEGVVLVSGMARGIDAIAHESCLKAGTSTLAVLGNGLSQVYPREHAHLMERILDGGSVLTEFFLQDPPRREHFPQRNRIISGLSLGVVLVEAGEKSGARITARCAMEQSREVFAVPGPIDAPLSFWPNQLISQGAKLVSSSADIMEEIPLEKKAKKLKSNENSSISLSLEARKLLEQFVMDTPIGVDDLARRVDEALPQVMQLLTELEMKGAIIRQPDARYVRIVA